MVQEMLRHHAVRRFERHAKLDKPAVLTYALRHNVNRMAPVPLGDAK